MTRERFERLYNINLGALAWEEHPNSRIFGIDIRTAVIGKWCIYQEGDDFYLVRDGSVHHWIVDLGKEVAA